MLRLNDFRSSMNNGIHTPFLKEYSEKIARCMYSDYKLDIFSHYRSVVEMYDYIYTENLRKVLTLSDLTVLLNNIFLTRDMWILDKESEGKL